MRVSIRTKMVALLVGVALLPLLAALFTVVVGGRQLRVGTLGKMVQTLAVAESEYMRDSLTRVTDRTIFALQDPSVVSYLENNVRERTPKERENLDAIWPTLRPTDKPLAEVLDNPVARQLRQTQRGDSRLLGTLVTDRYGQLVAATRKSADYYQADEDWWQGTYNQGRPRIYIRALEHDEATSSWSITICIPIMAKGQFLGVAGVEVDISDWLSRVRRQLVESSAAAMLVRGDGTIIYRHGAKGQEEMAEEWTGPVAERRTDWRLTQGGEIQGFAPIRLPDQIENIGLEMPVWMVVFYTPQSEAFRPIARLSMQVFAVGLGIILAIFMAGLFLVERGIVRRVLRLQDAAKKVAEGDLTHRLPRRRLAGMVGLDEIDELADAFNLMVQRVQKSYESLQAANQLKMDFVRVASHELRTPVSYILGMTKLLKDTRDPDRLQFAIQTMGAKANRLNEIIQAMFKLMPDQVYSQEMHYSEVDIRELLEEVYLDCFPFLEKRSQRLIIESVESLPPAQVDREKILDVVENLVINAIKFTPDGGVIKVRVGLQLGDRISIAVQDQGRGIPEADLPHIFQPFYSGGNVMLHSTGEVEYEKRGMGLGLTIVSHFIQLHGGTTEVSTGPAGTVFTVTIPVEPPLPKQRPQEPAL